MGTCIPRSHAADVVTVTFPLSSAVHEFPDDLFTNDERKGGAIMLHIVAVRTCSSDDILYDPLKKVKHGIIPFPRSWDVV